MYLIHKLLSIKVSIELEAAKQILGHFINKNSQNQVNRIIPPSKWHKTHLLQALWKNVSIRLQK